MPPDGPRLSSSREGPVVALIVLDGWGIRADRSYNAIAMARKPVYDALMGRYPHARLIASGEAVGLPAGQMGNSEVGHMNMGAGRVVYQDLTRIDKSIRDGEFFASEPLTASMDRAATGRHALHFIGLVSDGGVHSHQRHLHALIEMAARRHVPQVFVHVITDGRDTSPMGAIRYVAELEDVMRRAGVGRIATVSGRYYAMDRDKRVERTKLAYDAVLSTVPRHARRRRRAIGTRPCRPHMTATSPTSSSSRLSSWTQRALRSDRWVTVIRSWSSTSAPIAPGRLLVRSRSATISSTAFRDPTGPASIRRR